MLKKNSVLKSWLFILPFVKETCCSVGDSSNFYNHCLRDCNIESCSSGNNYVFQYNIFGFGISFWSCFENCEYLCQWKTVEAFQSRNWAVPQFRGKWPFIRLFGMQEPASVIFSIFNFLTVLKMFHSFRKKVHKSSPYYYLWHVYSFVCLNAWFWSSVYHTRDSDVTERLDYMSAFTMVLFSFYAMGLRYIDNVLNIKTVLWSMFCGSLALNHLVYLWSFNFDYSYNMKLNIVFGGLTVTGWLLWTYISYINQPYTWKVAAFSLLIALSTLLEITDFPPIFWLVDAHALWHLATGFINVIFYQFIIDDCKYLNELKSEKFDPESKIK